MAEAGLDRLRTAAQDALMGKRWTELLKLRPRLEGDGEFWSFLWAPAVAVALHRTGHPADGVALLTEAAADGFRQPDLFGELLTETFARDPGWPGLVAVLQGPLPRRR